MLRAIFAKGQPTVTEIRRRRGICTECRFYGAGRVGLHHRIFYFVYVRVHRLPLMLSRDNSICKLCKCPLSTKSAMPILKVRNATPANIKGLLPPACWILRPNDPPVKHSIPTATVESQAPRT